MLEEHLNEDSVDQIENALACFDESSEQTTDQKNESHKNLVSSPDSGFDNDEDIALNMADDLSNNFDQKLKKRSRFSYECSSSYEMHKVIYYSIFISEMSTNMISICLNNKWSL